MVRNLFHTVLLICMLPISYIYAQTTAIPDPYFEQALIDLGIDSDGTINGSVATSDIAGVTTLDISNRYIIFLTGIEDFAGLTELYCQNNWLNYSGNMDLSHNTNLEILNCSNQNYTIDPTGRRIAFNLNVSQNTTLEYLDCSNNILFSLNVNNNTNLKTLICSYSGLTSLDVGQNTKLEYLNCGSNYYVEAGGEYFPFTNLTLGQNANLTTINCSANEISNLDLTGSPALTYLNCASNKLTGLSVTQNANLEKLYCNNNQLTSLYLVENNALTEVNCKSNLLTVLNVKNGFNTFLSTFNASENLLNCIEVDNATAANAGEVPYDSWIKDDMAIYLEDCENSTAIPDANFEQALIYLGIDSDSVINGSVATIDIAGITSLDVFGFQIKDLTGIEAFTSLISLSCDDNELTSLDVSQNTNLQSLYCYTNQLTYLDVSKNSDLLYLSCGENELTNLDVSNNIVLQSLNCWNNQLIDLDVSKNIELQSLECYANELTSIDISQNVNLEYLLCMDNKLTNLNVKNGHNSILFLDAAQNSLLTCIQVDDADAANAGEAPYSSWVKDDIAVYSEECGALGLDDLLAQTTTLYPNPVTDILTIDSETIITKIEIYSILGKKVKDIPANFNIITLNNLSNGVYIVKVYAENRYATKKIIKL